MGLSFLINREQLQLVDDRKVIKQADFASVVNASGLLEAAQDESLRLIQRAGSEVERQRQVGYQEGWKAAQERLAVELTRMAAADAQALRSQQQHMVEAVVAIARQLVQSIDAELVFDDALRLVSEHVRAEAFLSVRVAPQDLEAASRAVKKLMLQYASTRFINVVADEQLQARSCVIESTHGVCDASLDTYLERLEQFMKQAR